MKAISWYDKNAAEVAGSYEMAKTENVHEWFFEYMPKRPLVILDVGAGSGRDAAYFSSLGHDVVAVEPSAGMRTEAMQKHCSAKIQWIDDKLPALSEVTRLGLFFDFILLSAVWMHLPIHDRPRAFRKLINLLKPGGFLAITLRKGALDQEREFYDVSVEELEKLARDHGAYVAKVVNATDALGRTDVQWIQVVIRLPDDGTGSLPILRSIVLNDTKSSTYKLGLLKALALIAENASGYARQTEDEQVAVPLGLVGLYWLRLYKPLLSNDLPQAPNNRGLEKLGFVKESFKSLLQKPESEWKTGAAFTADYAVALHDSIKEACSTIAHMPVKFTTYPQGGQIFTADLKPFSRRPQSILLEEDYLSRFGELRIPQKNWNTLVRFSAWVLPAVDAEWIRLMQNYAKGQERSALDDRIVHAAMKWSDPERNTSQVRKIAAQIMDAGNKVNCIWTDAPLRMTNLQVDHCLPWAVWSCNDLWNLFPVSKKANNEKRDRLPTIDLIEQAKERIAEWWEGAYHLGRTGDRLAEQFEIEVRASLPGLGNKKGVGLGPEQIIDALKLQRLRLKQDQQVAEWGN